MLTYTAYRQQLWSNDHVMPQKYDWFVVIIIIITVKSQYQGSHCSHEVKFKDFSRTFKDSRH